MEPSAHTMRRCTLCEQDLPRSQYYGNGRPNGLARICKECAKERAKQRQRAKKQGAPTARASRKRTLEPEPHVDEQPSANADDAEQEAKSDDDGDAAADAIATEAVRSHLNGITSTLAADTTGYSNDPYGLLKLGRLLTGEAATKKMKTQLKPSDFLKETLEGSRKFVTPVILSQFGKLLVAAKLKTSDHDTILLHLNMGRPRVTYFEADRKLMQRVLNSMSEYIDEVVEKKAKDAIKFLQLVESETSRSDQ